MMRKKMRLILASALIVGSALAGTAWWVASLGPPPLDALAPPLSTPPSLPNRHPCLLPL